jgi:hypothetical protein
MVLVEGCLSFYVFAIAKFEAKTLGSVRGFDLVTYFLFSVIVLVISEPSFVQLLSTSIFISINRSIIACWSPSPYL